MFTKLRSGSLSAVLSLAIIGNVTLGQVAYVTATLTPVAIVPALAMKACPEKDQLVLAAEDVLDVVESSSVRNALAAISPSAVATLDRAKGPARSLVTAIKNGDFTSAIGYINTIFPIIDEVAAHLKASPRVYAFIALANIALHFIIKRVTPSVPSIASRSPEAASTIKFGTREVWGCRVRKDKRCALLTQQ